MKKLDHYFRDRINSMMANGATKEQLRNSQEKVNLKVKCTGNCCCIPIGVEGEIDKIKGSQYHVRWISSKYVYLGEWHEMFGGIAINLELIEENNEKSIDS